MKVGQWARNKFTNNFYTVFDVDCAIVETIHPKQDVKLR